MSGVVAGRVSGVRGTCLWFVGVNLACEESQMGFWHASRALAGGSWWLGWTMA